MDWKMASFIVLGFWGTYVLFGNEATKVHGEKVSMLFEAVAMLVVVFLAFSGGGIHDFGKVTVKSFALAAIMGLMSAGGLYIQLYACRVAPQQIALIALITGMWPVVTVLATGVFRIGGPLLPRQWLGILLAGAGLALANWAK